MRLNKLKGKRIYVKCEEIFSARIYDLKYEKERDKTEKDGIR